MIDQLFSFVVAGKKIGGKQCVLVACYEEKDQTILNGARIPYECSVSLLKWNFVSEVLAPGVYAMGDIRKRMVVNKQLCLLINFNHKFGEGNYYESFVDQWQSQ